MFLSKEGGGGVPRQPATKVPPSFFYYIHVCRHNKFSKSTPPKVSTPLKLHSKFFKILKSSLIAPSKLGAV